MNEISITKSNYIPLSFLTGKDAYSLYNKGWGYSFVFSLQEIRDIYLAIRKYKYVNLSQFTNEYVILNVPHVGVPWSRRRVLENLNALVNFKLLTARYEPTNMGDLFEESQFGNPINNNDCEIFKNIFFSYYRFIDFSSLYLPINSNCFDIKELLTDNSSALFSFGSGKKYTDSFFRIIKDDPDIYYIPDYNKDNEKNSGCKMFWDVFISWGVQLKIIEKFNSSIFNCKLSNGKTFSCSYFLSSDDIVMPPLVDYVRNNYPNRRDIDLSLLIFSLCTTFRKSLAFTKNYIIEEYMQNKNYISLVRTSEIFIKQGNFIDNNGAVIYPKYKDSFISHLILRL